MSENPIGVGSAGDGVVELAGELFDCLQANGESADVAFSDPAFVRALQFDRRLFVDLFVF